MDKYRDSVTGNRPIFSRTPYPLSENAHYCRSPCRTARRARICGRACAQHDQLSAQSPLKRRPKPKHAPAPTRPLSNEYEDVRQVDNTVYTFATNYLDKVFKSRNYIINTISNLGIANIERNNVLKKIIIKSATGQ